MNINSYIKRHLFAYIKRSFGMLLIILIIDLLPLWGVLYWGWGTMDAVYLYFFETLILCLITFLKMRRASNIVAFAGWQKRLGNKAVNSTGKVGEIASKATNRRFGFIRFLLLSGFLLVNIPFCLLLMATMLWVEGKGFSLSAIFGYNGGHTDLFVMSLNTFYIMIGLLSAEYLYTYFSKYVKNQEYEKAGLVNEGLSFQLRVILQSVVLIGGVALMLFFNVNKVMMIFLILIKTSIDIFIYLRNRYWGNFVTWIESGMDKAGI